MKFDISKCSDAMTLNGWTQAIVARRAKVSAAVVSNFLNGKSVRIDTVKKIVTAIGLRMEEVVRGRVA